MEEFKLIDIWLVDATCQELKDFIESEEYTNQTILFLNWLLEKFENTEEYERCIIVKNEIDYRKDLHNRLVEEKNKFFDD